ncbi:MAG: DUF4124 domain-containing protein [Inhella sp.]
MRIRLWVALALLVMGGMALLVGIGPAGWSPLRLPQAPKLPSLPGKDASQVHKCRGADGQLLYSTEPCPKGQRPEPLGGQLNVVPATPLPQAPASSVLRQLNDPAEAAALREKRMEKAIQP